MNVDQQREATADLQLAVDFLRQEYPDQLGANYSELTSVPLMIARLRRVKQRHVDPAQPEVRSPYPSVPTPTSTSVESTASRRHWRRRRQRRGAIQQPDISAITSIAPAAVTDSLRLVDDLEKTTHVESVTVEQLTTEVASTAINDAKMQIIDVSDTDLVDERSDYADRLLRIAHGLHFVSIAILGVFVIQV